ncbi:hypothetical protein ACLB2K_050859 [Fragaria x ananassa]
MLQKIRKIKVMRVKASLQPLERPRRLDLRLGDLIEISVRRKRRSGAGRRSGAVWSSDSNPKSSPREKDGGRSFQSGSARFRRVSNQKISGIALPCGEFDLNVLLSKVDELGANLSPFLSQFRIEQGSEEHARIVGEVKRVGMGIGPERKNQGLFSLQVSIVRVLTTFHRCKRNIPEPVVKGEEIMVWVIGAERRRVRVPGEEKCSVCLEKFRIRSCVSMPCSHVFHTKCLETWLQGRNKRSCPLCRSEMPTRVGPSPIADMYHVGFILS